MEQETYWAMDKLHSSFSYKQAAPVVSSTGMHINVACDLGQPAQSAEYNVSLPISQNRPQEMNAPAILDLHSSTPKRSLDCQELSQLNAQEYSAMYVKLQQSNNQGSGSYLQPAFEVSRDAYLSYNMDTSIPEDLSVTSENMQSLRDFMAVSTFATTSDQPSVSGDQRYQVSQDENQVALLDPRIAALPLYFNIIDDASASPSMAVQQLRPSLASRPDQVVKYRNPYSNEIFGTERSPHRTQLQRESHILAERQRREEMNEKFTILRSMIPKLTKKDKASIVTDTINYIRELEKKVTYLQVCKEKSKGSLRSSRNADLLRLNSVSAGALDQCRVATLEISSLKEEKGSEDSPMSTSLEQHETASEKNKLGQVEVQDLGEQAVIKILSSRSRGVVLRLHLALDECRVDVIQSNVTTVGDNMIHFVTVGLNPGVSATLSELIAALQAASRPTGLA